MDSQHSRGCNQETVHSQGELSQRINKEPGIQQGEPTPIKQKLKRVDDEMAKKLKELQQLIASKEGMDQTADALNDCIVAHKNQKLKHREPAQYRVEEEASDSSDPELEPGGKNSPKNINKNASKTVYKVASEETIYHNVDGKYASSSSEDADVGPIDTSDELVECNKLVQTTRFFPGDEFERGDYSEGYDNDIVLARGRR